MDTNSNIVKKIKKNLKAAKEIIIDDDDDLDPMSDSNDEGEFIETGSQNGHNGQTSQPKKLSIISISNA